MLWLRSIQLVYNKTIKAITGKVTENIQAYYRKFWGNIRPYFQKQYKEDTTSSNKIIW